jgi:hypothetical protein
MSCPAEGPMIPAAFEAPHPRGWALSVEPQPDPNCEPTPPGRSTPHAGARAPSFRRRRDVDEKTALGGAGSRPRIASAQFCLGGVGCSATHR